MNSLLRIALLPTLAMLAVACGPRAQQTPSTLPASVPASAWYTAQFESGSIGEVQKHSESKWTVAIRNDNDNARLPYKWRSWWYLQLNDIPTDRPVHIEVTQHGWPYYYVPVYSYDGKTWHHYREDEVAMPSHDILVLDKQFQQKSVFIARFFPYTESDLKAFLATVESSPYVTRETIGETVEGRAIEMLTVTDPAVSEAGKKRIWIHARTHPAETGSSFVLEGLLGYLLGGDADARTALADFVFNIVPMHNVDGVVAGNYRSTPQSNNLELMWSIDSNDPRKLTEKAPPEVVALHGTITRLLSKQNAIPITVALNLHSSNHEPDTPMFFFPHFGPTEMAYTTEEARLWNDQLRFIQAVELHYGDGLVRTVPAEGGASFATSSYPETWWWQNFASDVMAITLETVYGRAGFVSRWVTPEDMRKIGRAVVLALLDFHDERPATRQAGHKEPAK